MRPARRAKRVKRAIWDVPGPWGRVEWQGLSGPVALKVFGEMSDPRAIQA